MMRELLLLCSAVVVSTLMAGLMRYFFSRLQLLDYPNMRSSHVIPTPRGGGLAIVVTFIVGCGMLVMWGNISTDAFVDVTAGGMMVAIIGFVDDHHSVQPHWRLLVHFVAAGWVLYWLGGVSSMGTESHTIYWSYFWNIAAAVGLVWLINLYNFMDGIDCIAAAEALFVSISAAVMFMLKGDGDLFMIAALLAAAVGGFVFWNLPPAKLFMGDVGSGFLGIVIGLMALSGITSGIVNIWVWMILLGVFLLDATVTLVRRLMRGSKCYEAHRNHAYQHLALKWKSHGRVTLAVTGVNLFWLSPWAIAAFIWPGFGPLFTVFAYLPLVFLVIRFRAGLDVIRD